MTKKAATDHPVHELIAERWSPHGFSDREVSEADIRSLFEAARWAASSYKGLQGGGRAVPIFVGSRRRRGRDEGAKERPAP